MMNEREQHEKRRKDANRFSIDHIIHFSVRANYERLSEADAGLFIYLSFVQLLC